MPPPREQLNVVRSKLSTLGEPLLFVEVEIEGHKGLMLVDSVAATYFFTPKKVMETFLELGLPPQANQGFVKMAILGQVEKVWYWEEKFHFKFLLV